MSETAALPPLYSSRVVSTPARADSDKANLSSDFETFLKMLTAQVQNQDPLNPVDSTDYATQLATFSSVEQQVLTNDLLREMGNSLSGGALQQMGNWIGMEALVRAPVMFEQTPITLRPEVATGADSAAVVVRDATGAVVQRLALEPGSQRFVWDGLDADGNDFAAGVYRFEIESYEGTTLVDSNVALTFSRIDEVRSDAGGVMLRLGDGSEVSSTMVLGVRAPDT